MLHFYTSCSLHRRCNTFWIEDSMCEVQQVNWGEYVWGTASELRRVCVRYNKWIQHTLLEMRNSMMNFWHMMPNERSAQLSKTAVASDWKLSFISLKPCIQKKNCIANCNVWRSFVAILQWCVQCSQPHVAILQWNMLSSRPHVATLQWCMHNPVGQMLQHCNGACTL